MGRKHNRVAFLNSKPVIRAICQTSKDGGWLALGACDQQDHLVFRHGKSLFGGNHLALIVIQISQLLGNAGVFGHAQTHKTDLAVMPFGGFQNLLHARNQRSEGGNNNAPLSLVENLLESVIDHAFRGCPARAFCVG